MTRREWIVVTLIVSYLFIIIATAAGIAYFFGVRWCVYAVLPAWIGIFSTQLITFVLARRREFILGWTMLVVGGTCNTIAVVGNDGRMPVSPQFWQELQTETYRHQLMTRASLAPWLCDILPWGTSIGDWWLLGGIVVAVVQCVDWYLLGGILFAAPQCMVAYVTQLIRKACCHGQANQTTETENRHDQDQWRNT
jgi:hypothetical protein